MSTVSAPGPDALNRVRPIRRTTAAFAWVNFIAEATYRAMPVSGGGTFILRFAEVNNVAVRNMGMDNVSVTSASVPEPSSLVLAASTPGVFGLMLRRSRKS